MTRLAVLITSCTVCSFTINSTEGFTLEDVTRDESSHRTRATEARPVVCLRTRCVENVLNEVSSRGTCSSEDMGRILASALLGAVDANSAAARMQATLAALARPQVEWSGVGDAQMCCMHH